MRRTAASAAGSCAQINRTRYGNDNTHCRTGASFRDHLVHQERSRIEIDIVTGVMFAREKVKVVAEQPVQHEFRSEATAVTVRVHVAKESEQPAAGWFAEFVPGGDYWPSGLGQISLGSDRIEKYCRGMGVPVPVSAGYATMWLPPTSGWLALREFSSFSSARTTGESRSERALDVGKDHDVTLNW